MVTVNTKPNDIRYTARSLDKSSRSNSMFGDNCLWNEQNIGISLNFTNSMHNKVRECTINYCYNGQVSPNNETKALKRGFRCVENGNVCPQPPTGKFLPKEIFSRLRYICLIFQTWMNFLFASVPQNSKLRSYIWP